MINNDEPITAVEFELLDDISDGQQPASTRWVLKETLALVVPICAVNTVTTLTNFIGAAMLAKLPDGARDVAAGAMINAAQSLITMTAMGMLISVAVVVSIESARQGNKRIGHALQQGCVLSILGSIPACLLIYFTDYIFKLLGQPLDVVEKSAEFFHVFAFAIFPFLLSMVVRQFITGLKKIRLLFISSLLNSLLTLAFAYCFMFGTSFFPAVGIAGLAWGHFLGNTLNLLGLLGVLYWQASYQEFEIFKIHPLAESLKVLKELWEIGWPIALNLFSEIMTLYSITIMAGWLPNPQQYLSEQQVIIQYYGITIALAIGLCEAATVLIGNAFGSGRFIDFKRLWNCNIQIGLIFSGILIILSLIMPGQLSNVFLAVDGSQDYYQALSQLKVLLPVVMVIVLFDSIRQSAIGALRGIKVTQYPMKVSLGSIWLFGMPIAAVLAFVAELNFIGITVGYAAGIILGAVLLVKHWYQQTSDENLHRLSQQNEQESETQAKDQSSGLISSPVSLFNKNPKDQAIDKRAISSDQEESVTEMSRSGVYSQI